MKQKKIIFILTIIFLVMPIVLAKSASMTLLATSELDDSQVGSTADVFLEVKPGSGRIFIDSFPLTKLDTVMSTRFANEIACDFLDKDCNHYDFFYTIRANAAIVGGPSAGAAISLLTISVLGDIPLDKKSAITGTINSGGLIGPVGGLSEKVLAAKEFGLTKVLIPKWSTLNDTEIENLTKDSSVKIVKVSNLREAIFEMSGKRIGKEYTLTVSEDYSWQMKNISEAICKRTMSLFFTEKNTTLIFDSKELYQKGNEAINEGNYYSAASYCFGANVKLKYAYFLEKTYTKSNVAKLISDAENKTKTYKKSVSKKEIKSFTDLQTLMVVTERIIDAEDYLNLSRTLLAENASKINVSLFNLAYGEERLYSAYSWATFFGTPGVNFNLDKDTIKNSCLNKVSEVEERIEYIRLYIPLPFDEIKKELAFAHRDFLNEDYSNCLYKASMAKSEVDIILNTMGLSNSEITNLIEERQKEAEQIIGRQIENNVFPIVGYSYYDYAISLKETDKFSSLLYMEYAIELSKLDIYFKQEKFDWPIIQTDYIGIFLIGGSVGFLACYFWMIREINKGKKSKK
ncbi:MAG: S16 family serine protease [archaeon]